VLKNKRSTHTHTHTHTPIHTHTHTHTLTHTHTHTLSGIMCFKTFHLCRDTFRCVYKQSQSCVSRQILQHIVCAMTHSCVSDSFMCTRTHCTLNRLWTHRVHTATHCNTLQHTTTHNNTLQHEQTLKTSCTQTNYTHFHMITDCLTTSEKLSVVCCKSKDRVTLLSISIILWIHFVLVIAGWGGLLQILQLLPVA